jgi:hypothetical protein
MRGLKAWANPASRKESPMWRTTVLGGMGGGSAGGADVVGEALGGTAAVSAGVAAVFSLFAGF